MYNFQGVSDLERVKLSSLKVFCVFIECFSTRNK